MFKTLLLCITLAFLLAFVYNSINIKYAKEIKNPIYEGIMGERLIMVGDNKFLTIIEDEMSNGNIKKINVSVNTIDISSFHNIGRNNSIITHYEDNNYFYTIHNGEDKVIIREKK
jgi:hypothetical protein